jgi:hypothetical protein
MGHTQDFKFQYVRLFPLLLPLRLESATISDPDVLMAILGKKNPTRHVSHECALANVKLLTAFIMAGDGMEEYSKLGSEQALAPVREPDTFAEGAWDKLPKTEGTFDFIPQPQLYNASTKII